MKRSPTYSVVEISELLGITPARIRYIIDKLELKPVQSNKHSGDLSKSMRYAPTYRYSPIQIRNIKQENSLIEERK